VLPPHSAKGVADFPDRRPRPDRLEDTGHERVAAPRRALERGKSGTRGDQYVRLVVVLPKDVDPDLKAEIEKSARTHPYKVRGKLGTD